MQKKISQIKFFISNNIKLAIKYQLNGIYIPAFNKQINFIKYLLPKNFKIIGSAHNNVEILIKQKQGCEIIFVSPIFKVKKKSYFLDVVKFNLLILNKKKNLLLSGELTARIKIN